MRIDAFRDAQAFKKDMDLWIRRFKEAKPISANQPVLIPGEPEFEMHEKRLVEGIPLLEMVWEDIRLTADKFNIKL
jgi:LDH2 family malate/lactate/ureidoglycolate dehydrogenase